MLAQHVVFASKLRSIVVLVPLSLHVHIRPGSSECTGGSAPLSTFSFSVRVQRMLLD